MIHSTPACERIHPSETGAAFVRAGCPVPLPARPVTRAPYFSFLASTRAVRATSLSGYSLCFTQENEVGASSKHFRATSSVGTRRDTPSERYKAYTAICQLGNLVFISSYPFPAFLGFPERQSRKQSANTFYKYNPRYLLHHRLRRIKQKHRFLDPREVHRGGLGNSLIHTLGETKAQGNRAPKQKLGAGWRTFSRQAPSTGYTG